MLDSHDAVRVFRFAQVRGDASVAALHEKLDAEFHAVNAEFPAVNQKLDHIPLLVKQLFNSYAVASHVRVTM